MTTAVLKTLSTPVGNMTAVATAEALCLLEFSDRPMLPTQMDRIREYVADEVVDGENVILRETERQLTRYFQQETRVFDLPLDLSGTEFQNEVWNELLGIAYGETISYAELSRRIGNPGAIRAVGRANGDNRIAIIVPCHRVIASDGSLQGYGGGLWRKQKLLDLESKVRQPSLFSL